MVDPVSIVTGVIAVAEGLKVVTENIYEFVQATKSVDRSINSLLSQAKGLSGILDALALALDHETLNVIAADNQNLWTVIQQTANSCSGTVDALKKKLKDVETPKQGQLKQGWRQFKLGLKQEEIDRILSEMNTHSINLQISVGIVNLLATTATPTHVLGEQALRFEKLEKMISTVNDRLSTLIKPPTADEHINNVELDENTEALKRTAEPVMTIASESIAAQSAIGDVPIVAQLHDEAAFVYFAPAEEESREIESTTGSERGAPLQNIRRSQIQDWIQAAPTIFEDMEGGVPLNQYRSAPVENLGSVSGGPGSPGQEDDAGLVEESSDDDIDFDIVQRQLAKATISFASQDFAGSGGLFSRALTRASTLTPKKQQRLELEQTKIMLGTSYLHIGKLDEAEPLLLEVAKQPLHTAADIERNLEAFHLLACLHLRRRNLDVASTHCRQALKGRKRTPSIGANHSDYFASCRLYVVISFAKGNRVEAEDYSWLLPSEQRPEQAEISQILEKEFPSPSLASDAKSEAGLVSEDASENAIEPENTVVQVDTLTDSLSSEITKDPQSNESPQPNKSPVLEVHPTLSNSDENSSTKVKAKQITPTPHSSSTKDNVFSIFKSSKRLNEQLQLAVSSVDREKVLEILRGPQSRKVNVDGAIGPRSQSLLSVAAMLGSFDICESLLAANATVDQRDNANETALMYAVDSGHFEICWLLLRHGASPSPKKDNGDTLLEWASKIALGQELNYASVAICALLIDFGAKLVNQGMKSRLDQLELGSFVEQTFFSTKRLNSPKRHPASLEYLPTLQLLPIIKPKSTGVQFYFGPISRTLPTMTSVILVGRYSEAQKFEGGIMSFISDAPIGFKSRVVSKRHCEFSYDHPDWAIRDIGSSSGTFLRGRRLSREQTVSDHHPLSEGDVIQLGIDFQGGTDNITRCVRFTVHFK